MDGKFSKAPTGQVVDAIIAELRFGPKSPLALARDLGLNHGTVRKALRRLAMAGAVTQPAARGLYALAGAGDPVDAPRLRPEPVERVKRIAPTIATTSGPQSLTMSSVEIAELCEKQHGHVMRDIKRMLDDLAEVASNFGGHYHSANGKRNPCYHLPKELTLTLVSGYDVVMRRRIIAEWSQREDQVAPAPATQNLRDINVLIPLLRDVAEELEVERRQRLEAERWAETMRKDFAAHSLKLHDYARVSN